MAIAYVGAGTGVERTTAGTSAVSKTGCTAGNLIIAHSWFGADTGDGGFTGWSNVESLEGIDNSATSLINSVNRQVLIGRAMADGTCSVNILCGASGDDVVARLYEFSGVATATTVPGVFENGAGTNSEVGFSATTTVLDADVTTNGADRLALNFVGIRSASAVGPFTGETGGDWTEAAEYNGTGLTLQLQTATMAAAGIIDGGSVAIASAYWITIGTALIPFVTPATSAGRRMLTLGTG